MNPRHGGDDGRKERDMSVSEMDSKVKELRELRRMAEELQAEIDGITDSIKAEMTARNTDTLTGMDWKITWKPVTSNRIDTAAIKKELPDIAARYTKASVSRRFTLA